MQLRAIDRAAVRWIASLSDDAPMDRRRAFEAWLGEDTRHGDAFLRVRGGEADGIAAVRETRGIATVTAVQVPRRPALALTIAVIALIGGGLALERQDRTTAVQHDVFTADRDGGSLSLVDGSRLTLAAGTSVRVDFDGKTRRIALARGSARFAVAHDAAHPFIVFADGQEIVARGTVFDVALEPGGVTVSMIDGLVEIRRITPQAAPRGPIRLARGQRLIARGDTETVEPMTHVPAPLPVANAPKVDAHDDSATTLAALVGRVNQGARLPIRLEDDIGALRLRGTIDVHDSAAFAHQVALAYGLTLTVRDGMLVLSRPKP